ncbi:hypothetical protein KIN20_018421 [Parelaphostrongylus tenuis]|uniref:Uncharacterized protein n=1 Tax=Parelaphostrongylus tenuis TaxID=148309 RepID=A0AAD5N1X7_PARTN|nr:hypothetical protein KIN20_018421 [Parelaphostrongylus tenuis]
MAFSAPRAIALFSTFLENRTLRSILTSQTTGADVLLDGDSAFAVSAVSDLRTLPEHARTLAKQLKAQIEAIFDSGRMNVQTE